MLPSLDPRPHFDVARETGSVLCRTALLDCFGTPGRYPFWVLIVHLKPNSNAEDYDMYQAVKHREVSCLEILLHVNTLLSFWDELFR